MSGAANALPRLNASLFGLSGGELLLLLIALLFAARSRLRPGAGFEKFKGLVAEALDIFNRTAEIQDPNLDHEDLEPPMKFNLALWIAQGFGVGRIPVAPGTFGSAIGMLWFALLLLPGNFWFYAGAMIAGIFLSVWLCGAAEKVLRQTDPGSIVLDEIIALPICFAAWVGKYFSKHGAMPGPEHFFSSDTWPLTLALFVGFRLFDVIKPWPIRQSQKLPGGWGVTLDDVLAALYVNVLTALAFCMPAGR